MKTRILLVEDDDRLANLTAEYLRKNDFEVNIEGRGDTAEARILNDDPELVILDVMLPGKDGFEVCRAVREKYNGVILMLTARDEDLDQILGPRTRCRLITSPSLYRRACYWRVSRRCCAARPSVASTGEEEANPDDAAELAFGSFRISQATRSAHLGDEAIDLTTAEFDLLWLLARHAGSIPLA